MISLQPQEVWKYLRILQLHFDSSDIDQSLIPSDRTDSTTIKVAENSASDTTSNTYTKATSITELDGTSKVFFLQEAEDGQFEIYFGDGVIGKALDDGNIINISYVVTNKTEANGATTFSLSGSISGFNDVTLTVNSSHNWWRTWNITKYKNKCF